MTGAQRWVCVIIFSFSLALKSNGKVGMKTFIIYSYGEHGKGLSS